MSRGDGSWLDFVATDQVSTHHAGMQNEMQDLQNVVPGSSGICPEAVCIWIY